MISLEVFLRLLDLGGTFVFAISGAVAAVNRRLDIFGILVLSFVAGTVGGITRDLLIGAVPPAALKNESYLLTTVIAGLLTFFFYKGIDRLRAPVLWFDAAGLSFFAVAGTEKALEFGLNPLMAALLGMVTGIGGGMVRDLLLIEIPQVLRSDLYAVAALAGAAMVVLGQMLGLPPALRHWPGASCASACASWRFATAGLCRSRISRRADGQRSRAKWKGRKRNGAEAIARRRAGRGAATRGTKGD